MRPRTNQFKHHLGPSEHAVSNPSFIIELLTYEVMKEEEDALLKFWHCSG